MMLGKLVIWPLCSRRQKAPEGRNSNVCPGYKEYVCSKHSCSHCDLVLLQPRNPCNPTALQQSGSCRPHCPAAIWLVAVHLKPMWQNPNQSETNATQCDNCKAPGTRQLPDARHLVPGTRDPEYICDGPELGQLHIR